ncbi:hypothetical protein HS7_13220 [Sulfolobales archaeon HS-7]|nr:hypothetical protein HS7_13220 [Sulfolobales archaeon HS-7]
MMSNPAKKYLIISVVFLIGILGGIAIGLATSSVTASVAATYAKSHPLTTSNITAILEYEKGLESYISKQELPYLFISSALTSIVGVIAFLLFLSIKLTTNFPGSTLGVVGSLIYLIVQVIGVINPQYSQEGVTGFLSLASGNLTVLGVLSILFIVIGLLASILLGIGFFKSGSAYNNTIIKVGGILFIIPGIDVIAVFLLVFGYLGAMRNRDS